MGAEREGDKALSINVAIIGCRTMGQVHAAMATAVGCTVVKCIDKDLKAAKALAKQYGAAAGDDPAKAFKRKDVEVVCIASPTPTHKPLVAAAAKAGKDIFCEKPLCRTEKECADAISAAEKAGVKLFVGHVVRYFQEYEAIRAQVRSGAISTPGFVRMFRGGQCPDGTGSWFRDFKQSGGVVMDCSIHDIDWVRYTFGEITRVYCQNLMRKQPEPMDYAVTTLRLADDLVAQVTGSWAHPSGFRTSVEVCGARGMLQYDSAQAPIISQPRASAGGGGGGAIVPKSPVAVSPYQLEWEDALAWFQRDRTPRVLPEDALRAVQLAEAALKSAETGQPVKV